jgi:hypothetical protein
MFGESGQGDNYKGTLFEQWLQNGLTTTALGTKEAFAAFGVDMQGVVIQALQAGANMGAKTIVSQVEDWVPAGQDGGNFVPRDVFTRVFDETAQELETIPKTIRDMIRGVDVEGMKDQEVTDLFNKINATVQGVVDLTKVLEALPFNNLIKSSFDTKASLIALADAMDNVAGNGVETLAGYLTSYVDNFYTEEEKRLAVAESISKTLKAGGVSFAAEDILKTTREQFRALVTNVEAAASTGDEAAQKLLLSLYSVAGAYASIIPVTQETTGAVEDLADAMGAIKEATDAAFSALERSVGAARNTAQDVATELLNLFDLLGANVRQLYGEVDSTASMTARQGSDFISQALATAKATGYLPDSEELAQAITAARGGIVESKYASKLDLDYDRLKLAGKLQALQDIAGPQLTEAERQVQYLDDILENARKQLDTLRGIDNSMVSVAEALARFYKAMAGEGYTGGTPTSGGAASGAFTVGGDASPAAMAKYNREVVTLAGSFSSAVTDASEIARLDQLAALIAAYNGSGNVAGGMIAARDAGFRLTDIQAVTGYRLADLQSTAESLGIPAFERGTNYVQQDGLAYLHEGEEVVPARATPGWRADSNSDTLSVLRSIDRRLSVLESNTEATATHAYGTKRATEKSADYIERLSDGGVALRVDQVAA